MACYRGHHGDNMVVLYLQYMLIVLISTSAVGNDSSPWYRGCHHVTPAPPANGTSIEDRVQYSSDPVLCSKFCLSHRRQFVLVHQEREMCSCTDDEGSLSTGPEPVVCNTSCHGNSLLQCGGESGVSVYLSEGPYLMTADLIGSISSVYPGQMVAVTVQVTMASMPNVTLGVQGVPVETNPADVTFSWSVDEEDHSEVLTAVEPSLVHILSYRFYQPGHYIWRVHISNILSSLKITFNQTVLPPVPTGLQIALITLPPFLPSCIPKNVVVPRTGETVTAFTASEVQFEASVTIGNNLTFHWWFENPGNTFIVVPEGEGCEGTNCTRSIMAYTFQRSGVFEVGVNVSSALGHLSHSISVIIVDQYVSDLGLSLIPGTPSVLPQNHQAKFQVKVEATNIQGAILETDFGDGNDVAPFPIQARNGSLLKSVADPSKDQVFLASSYGEGCELTIQLAHKYKTSGRFNVTVRFTTNQTQVNTTLVEGIQVLQLLKGPVIQGPHVVSMGNTVNFTVSFQTKSSIVEYLWSVTNLDTGWNSNHTTHIALLTYKFLQTGEHKVQMRASNRVSVVHKAVSVEVQEPVGNVTVTVDSATNFISTGESVKFTAEVDQGSAVDFEWDFQNEDSLETHLVRNSSHSVVRYTFFMAGNYNVSTEAFNKVSRKKAYLDDSIHVEQPVAGLTVRASQAVARGNVTLLVATVITGNPVKFEVDFGQGRENFTSDDHHRQVTIEKSFDTPGSQLVTVFAYNNVSMATINITIENEEEIGPVGLITHVNPVKMEPVVFVALRQNKSYARLSDRQDVVYTWMVEGRVIARTQAPCIDWTFQETGGYNVSLVVSNHVSQVGVWQRFNMVELDSEYRFQLPGSVTPFNQPTNFTLVNLPADVGLVRVDYKLGGETQDTKEYHAGGNATNMSWNYLFPKFGLWEVDANAMAESGLVTTVVSLEVPLQGLRLLGPTAVSVNSTSAADVWIAHLDSGTRVIYEWKADHDPPIYTAKNKLTIPFALPGLYNVSVQVSNGLGTLEATREVLVEYPITEILLRVEPVVLNDSSGISVNVTGGPECTLDFDFGDGSSTVLTSTSPELEVTQVKNPGGLPCFIYRVYHEYALPGEHSVVVNVSNSVSWLKRKKEAQVEEPITGLKLFTSTPRVVSTNQLVVVEATVETGTNLLFDWDFDDTYYSPKVNTSGHRSVAEKTYGSEGLYSVIVVVSHADINDDSSPTLKAELDFEFDVVEPVAEVTLRGPEKYAAELVLMENGNNSTDVVSFVAQARLGTDVSFTFDFGDGTSVTLEGTCDFFCTTHEAEANHKYKTIGEYVVKVLAHNRLNNVTVELDEPIHVQVAPGFMSLDKEEYDVQFGEECSFTVEVHGGTHLTYDWDMGDETQYVDAETTVRHTYHRPDVYTVVVKAHNEVNDKKTSATVNVLIAIQGVTLIANTTLVATSESVRFDIQSSPINAKVTDCLWYFEQHVPNIPDKQRTIFNIHKFTKAGEAVVWVTGFNAISEKTSDPVIIQVVEPISGKLELIREGKSLIGKLITFHAYHYSGSPVTYSWDFGDGTKLNTTNSTQSHVYNRINEYNVTVCLFNALSKKTITMKVFVLEKECETPEITLLTPPRQQHLTFMRSQVVKLEAEVTVDCTITSATLYTWTIRNATSGDIVSLSGYTDRKVRDPILILPGRSLQYGDYSVQLKVEMENTIVHDEVKADMYIVASPLLPVIAGGIQRHVSRSEDIVLDGSLSLDPDFPEADDIVYHWSCNQSLAPESPCFHDNDTSAMDNNTVKLRIPGHRFSTDKNEFMFTLMISRPNRPPQSASQFLEIKEEKMLSLRVLCNDCTDSVNSDQRLILQADHPDCLDEDLTYVWELYKVRLEDTPTHHTQLPHTPRTCFQDDQHPDIAWLAMDNRTTTINNTAGGAVHGEVPTPSTVVTTPTSNLVATTPTTTSTTGRPNKGFNFDVSEASSGGRHTGFQRDIPERDDKKQTESDDRPGVDGPVVGEGKPGDAGSAGGRQSGQVNPAEAPGSQRPDNGDTDPQSGEGSRETNGVDPAIDDLNPIRKFTHIMSRRRTPVGILPKDTATGINSKALVLKENVLQQGTTYIVELNVTHRGTKQKGNAAAYFRVNWSPSKGACSIRRWTSIESSSSSAANGIEMETEFSTHCKEWTDEEEDLPIRYEIGYSLEEDGIQDLIYQGLNYQVRFFLPAGNPETDYSVFVHISVLDSLGARTAVCREKVQIRPRTTEDTAPTNKTQEEILYELVEEDASTLQTYVVKGDNRQARLHAQLVAHRLNRLHYSIDEQRYDLRKKIRRAMLWALRDLPIRDEYEVQQTASAVAISTAKGDELTPESLDLASEILQRAVKQVDTIAQTLGQVDSAVVSLAMQGTANIIAAATEQAANLDPKEAESVVHNSTSAIHTLLKTELKHTVIGEEPVTQATDYLVAVAGRYKVTSKAMVIEADNANFKLPSNMKDLLANNARSKVKETEEFKSQTKQEIEMGLAPEEDVDQETQQCYETHMVTFKQNPYCYGNRNDEIQTRVASLTLFSCEGEELVVQNLTRSNHIHMEIPNHSQEENSVELEWHTLLKHRMNLHQFNMSKEHNGHALHILIDLQPVPQGRLFPIAVLLNAEEPPRPNHYLKKHEFSSNLNRLTIFIEPYSLNESNLYYLGVVDATLNAGQRRVSEVTERRYQLHAWWSECLYWDHSDSLWSSAGCQVLDTSSVGHTHCGCSHLTSFGARFSLVPNDLSFTDVEDFFDLHENPVTFSFIATLLGLYLLLLVVCVRLDARDHRKGTIVPLVDNNKGDNQKYIICIETGFRHGAGTTARVSMVLHGEDGMSDTRELISESGRPLFERNSRDIFIMTLPESLGPVWKVQMWHNNAGPSPSWYLSRVTVKDVNTGAVYYFSCEKWFAVEEEDGKVDREITRAEGGFGFSKVLWAKGTQYLADYHLWMSMLTRPSYSRFTRAQRLTCCLALLMSYMAVNAAWYRTSEKEYRGEFGLIDVSWRSVAVGAITAIIVLPVNLLIVFLFRRSKVKRLMLEELPSFKKVLEKHTSMASFDSTARLLQPAVMPSIFDQSILNWQSLQEWAQKQWAKRYEQSVSSSHQSVKPTHTATSDPPNSQTTQVSQSDEAQPTVTNQQTGTAPRQRTGTRPSKQGYETDQTSSGFEDYTASLDRSRPPTDSIATRQARVDALNEAVRHQQEFARCVIEGMRSKKARRFFLPRLFQYLGWIMCFLVVAGGATITVLYGFRFGHHKSILWLQSLFFSVLQCVFITHPLLVAVISLFTAWKYRNDLSIFDHHDDGIIIEKPKKLGPAPNMKGETGNKEVDLAEGIAARQRSRYLRFARPPDEKHLIEARKQTMKQKKSSAIFRESVVFASLFILLGFIAYGKDTTSPYHLNESLKNIFVKGGSHSFESISTVPEFWDWTQNHLVEALFGGLNVQAKSEKVYISNSIIIGKVSLRQVRIREESCQLPSQYQVTGKCRYGYQQSRHDTFPHNSGNETWWHVGGRITKAQGIQGHHAYYDASGYQMLLPSDMTQSFKLFQNLARLGWIDKKTRGVMIELTLFNVATNLFSSVRLVLEVPATGAAFPLSSITSVYLYKYLSSLDNIILACELFYMIAALLLLHHEVGEIVRLKKEYLKNAWNYLQVVLCLVSLCYISCYVYRFVLVGNIVELFRETYFEEFVDISFVSFWDHLLRCLVGILIFVVTLTFLKLLRNHRCLAKLTGVYKKAAREISYVGAMFVIWMGAYTSLGTALFHSTVECFRSFWWGISPVAGLMTGIYEFEEVSASQEHWMRIFIVSFMILALGSLTSFMVAILSWNYKTYREDWLPSMTSLEALSYFWHKFLVITGFRHPWPFEEDEDNYLSPEFTMAEIEYQVDEMLFKMNALAGTSNLPEKPPIYFTDSDCTYNGNGDDGISTGSEERHFDDDRFTHRIHKIEDQLLVNEPHLACLLHLDSIGAEVLTEEREKQLRSQLELEIFRQLQMQRHGNRLHSDRTSGSSYQAHLTASHTNSGNSRNSTGSSDSGNSSSRNSTGGNSRKSNSSSGNISSSSQGSSNTSPSMHGVHRGNKPPFPKPPSLSTLVPDDMIPSDPIKAARLPNAGLVSPRDVAAIHVNPKSNQSDRINIEMSEGLTLQDLSDNYDSSKPENGIPLKTLEKSKADTGTKKSDRYKPEAETRLQDDQTSGSGVSSGGAEVQAVLSNEPLGGARRKEYNPPETSNKVEESKLQIRLKGHRGDKLSPRECLYDSSSSSEIDAAKHVKVRSLRKTRSRGKGKGRGRLSPVDVIDMIEEIGFDNEGYHSDGNKDMKAREASNAGIPRNKQKLAWN